MSRSKEQRQLQAKHRRQDRDKRTPEDQLDVLDKRLGPGVGAERERARLALSINGSNTRGESS